MLSKQLSQVQNQPPRCADEVAILHLYSKTLRNTCIGIPFSVKLLLNR